MAQARKCLNFDFDFFIDISKQVAYRRYLHRKFWNVFLHTITTCILVWCAFFLTSYILPVFIMRLNLAVILFLCMKQDNLLGLVACLAYPVVYYHALNVSNASFLQVCSLVVLTCIVQVYVGEKWMESREPFTTATKGGGGMFTLCDYYNEVYLGFFHCMATLFVRLELRLDLLGTSDNELRMILGNTKNYP